MQPWREARVCGKRMDIWEAAAVWWQRLLRVVLHLCSPSDTAETVVSCCRWNRETTDTDVLAVFTTLKSVLKFWKLSLTLESNSAAAAFQEESAAEHLVGQSPFWWQCVPAEEAVVSGHLLTYLRHLPRHVSKMLDSTTITLVQVSNLQA